MNQEITHKYIDRFWSKVRKTDSCWVWTGTIIRRYGQYAVNLDRYRPHRLSWILKNGTIPRGKLILHKCDNGLCCRPSHLYCGTHKQNMDDRNRRFRTARGERTYGSKLTDKIVKRMWRMRGKGFNTYQTWKALPVKVSYSAVKNVFAKHTWTHI